MVEYKLSNTHSHHNQSASDSRNDTHNKSGIVPATDTVVQPLAMMIEMFDAFVTCTTVFSPRARGPDVAQVTATVLNDMGVFGSVKLRHGDRHLEQSQLRVSRVEKEGSQVGRQVNQEERCQHREERQTQGGP